MSHVTSPFFKILLTFSPTSLQGEIHTHDEAQWSWGLDVPLDSHIHSLDSIEKSNDLNSQVLAPPSNSNSKSPSLDPSLKSVETDIPPQNQQELRVYSRQQRNK